MPTPYVQLAHWFEKNGRKASIKNLEDHEPMYMYHVSVRQLSNSDNVFLTPKRIESSEWEIEGIRRICVTPTIEQCLIAVSPQSNSDDQFYVYRTHTKVSRSAPPYGVYDAPLSQERWLHSKRRFNLVATIPRFDSPDISCPRDGIREDTTSKFVGLDFSGRGGHETFDNQWKELGRLRRFMKEHDHQYFINDIEKQLHDNQRNTKTNLNRVKAPFQKRKTKNE